MTDAERMKEMEELLREARAKICGGFSTMNKQNFHERLNTILDPPPDPDALVRTLFKVWEDASATKIGGWEGVAAWVDADRVVTWNAAIKAAAARVTTFAGMSNVQDINALRKPITRNEP